MKRNSLIVVLSIMFVLTSSSFAFAAPIISGTWTGKVIRVTPSSCSSLSVTLTLSQCGTSNLVRGILVVGSDSINLVGRIKPDGATIIIHGLNGDYESGNDVTLTGKYTAGSPARIKISNVDWSKYVNYELQLVQQFPLGHRCGRP